MKNFIERTLIISIMLYVLFLGLVIGIVYSQYLPDWKWLEVIAATVAVLGLSLAGIRLCINRRADNSKYYMDHARNFFELAYNELLSDGRLHTPGDRFKWLTCARYINTALSLQEKIKDAAILYCYIEVRNIYRNKFRTLLENDECPLDVNYFRESPEKIHFYSQGGQQPLNLSSVDNVFDFMRWPEDQLDNLDTTKKTLEDFNGPYISQYGFRQYLREFFRK